MIISMNWIQDFVDLRDIDINGLIQRFTLSTAEVEKIEIKGADTEGIVIGEILSIKPISDSDTLHLLDVDIGEKTVQCICSSSSIYTGMKTAFAPKCTVVRGKSITTQIISGYESYGMCCSEADLQISSDNSKIMEIPDDIPPGTPIKTIYDIDDIIFEIDNKSLTNRPDLWGHYGIAREFSVLTDRPLKKLDLQYQQDSIQLPPVSIEIQSDLVHRYSAVTVENVRELISPINMRIRLFYCGLRSVNLLADLTNYLMLETGQPMHAFDLRRVRCVEVKCFENNFVFQTLDGENRNIDKNTLMICSQGEPVAVAGIMGGTATEIKNDTDSFLLESAVFEGINIRKTMTRLRLRTDAGMRYEKILDPEMTVIAIRRFLSLLQKIDPGVKITSEITDKYLYHYPTIHLDFNKSFVDRYAGISISDETIMKTLPTLGFSVQKKEDHYYVTVPSWRSTKDVTIKVDLIEEITRIYGYDNFEIKPASSVLRPVRCSLEKTEETMIKNLLVRRFNLHEVHSYIWENHQIYNELGLEIEPNVQLYDETSPEHAVIRNSMIPSLLEFIYLNRSYSPEFGIFEIGRVVEGFLPDGNCNERKKLGLILFSRTKEPSDLFCQARNIIACMIDSLKYCRISFSKKDISHTWQHPSLTYSISCGDQLPGIIGILHPAVQKRIDKKSSILYAEIDISELSSIPGLGITYISPSKYPEIGIDFSFYSTSYSPIREVIENSGSPLLQNVKVIDIYNSGKSDQSISVRLSFGTHERTLLRSEIQIITDKIIDDLAARKIFLRENPLTEVEK